MYFERIDKPLEILEPTVTVTRTVENRYRGGGTAGRKPTQSHRIGRPIEPLRAGLSGARVAAFAVAYRPGRGSGADRSLPLREANAVGAD